MPEIANNISKNLARPVPSVGDVSLSPTIKLSNKNYQALKNFLINRIKYAHQFTDSRAQTYDKIDRQLLGCIYLNSDDKRRAKDNQRGKSAAVTDVNLAIGQAQIDTCVTALINLLVPTSDMYEAYSDADGQPYAQALAAEMTDNADKFGHIVEIHKALNDGLKYNLCGLLVEWIDVAGNRIANDSLNQPVVEQTTIYSGNRLTHLDMRNTFYSPTVLPEKLSTDGQYAGYVEKVDAFKINELIDQAEIYGNYLRANDKSITNVVAYNEKPDIQNPATTSKYTNSDGTTNYDALFATGDGTVGANFNLITMFCKIRPYEFGLGEDAAVSVWKFRILNSEIVYAKQLDNAHGRLPIVLSTVTLDGLDDKSPSYGEHLIPLQNFCSYLLNVKQRAYRKQLYGINFYKRDNIDMREALEKGDKENLWIPVDSKGNEAIASMVQHFNDAPNTESVIPDMANIKTIMQDILPTDSRSLLANLSRVSQWQAQRTVAETDKRTVKIGRLLNSTLLRQIKFIQVYNILQYKDNITVLNNDGQYEDIKVSDLRNTNIEMGISSALRGIDKDLLADKFKDMLNILVQMPHITSEIDITKALDYWSSLAGADMDLSQFKVESPFDKLTPEQKQAAYQLLVQTAATQQARTDVDSAVNSMPPVTELVNA